MKLKAAVSIPGILCAEKDYEVQFLKTYTKTLQDRKYKEGVVLVVLDERGVWGTQTDRKFDSII